MALSNIFDIAGSGMSAESVRLNTVASNLANADSVSSSADSAYKARYPVFQAVQDSLTAGTGPTGAADASAAMPGVRAWANRPRPDRADPPPRNRAAVNSSAKAPSQP